MAWHVKQPTEIIRVLKEVLANNQLMCCDSSEAKSTDCKGNTSSLSLDFEIKSIL